MQNQLPSQISQIGGPIGGIQTNMPQQMNQIGPGQLGPGQMQQQLNHIQRKVFKIFLSSFLLPRYISSLIIALISSCNIDITFF